MPTLLDHLREFNRKERFYLIGMALGNTKFRLPREFREALGDALELRVPEDAFAAMDYHLDWLAASLHLAANGGTPGPHLRSPQIFKATQEDIDLLVAYDDKNGSHVILLEAKGVTGFSNKQFRSKAKRLKAIFGSQDAKKARAMPRFALISPQDPQQLDYSCCPSWMLGSDRKVPWLRLLLPCELKKVVRCHEDGTVSQKGDYWKVVLERRTG